MSFEASLIDRTFTCKIMYRMTGISRSLIEKGFITGENRFIYIAFSLYFDVSVTNRTR